MSDQAPQSAILELQRLCIDTSVPVSKLLLTAKLLASKIDSSNAIEWINLEIEGYEKRPIGELPSYRRIQGTPKALNPYRGWQPIILTDEKNAEYYTDASTGLSIPAIENLLSSNSSDDFNMPLSGKRLLNIQKSINFECEIAIFLPPSALAHIVSTVRKMVLEWTIELERHHVVGAGFVFEGQEKSKAKAASDTFITNNIQADTVQLVGNVSGDGAIVNQSATRTVDVEKVKDLVSQIRDSIDSLPEQIRAAVAEENDKLDRTLQAAEIDQVAAHSHLSAIRDLCMNVTGSLVAQGIVSLVGGLLQ